MSSSPFLPPPPDDRLLEPLIEVWESARPWIRCHNARFGATEFNPGLGTGRFHPFAGPGGAPVPTLYGAGTLDGALSETVFHAVPFTGPDRAIRRSALRPLVASTLACTRPLRLIQLHGHGLRKLEVSRRQLLDGEAADYARTVRWAQALHRSLRDCDGLVWISRLHDTSRSLVLFGDRVARGDLEVVDPPLPLALPPGFLEVQRAADESGITVLD